MIIPPVNAGITDRNREQTKKLCLMLEYEWWALRRPTDLKAEKWQIQKDGKTVFNPENGSLTLDQAVAMLTGEGWKYIGSSDQSDEGWYSPVNQSLKKSTHFPDVSGDAHDLTAALDALIAALKLAYNFDLAASER